MAWMVCRIAGKGQENGRRGNAMWEKRREGVL